MSLKKEKMANVDTAWWQMEEPTNLMMITAIMVIEGQVDYPRLLKTIEQRLLKFDRFRQRVVDSPSALGPVNWELDPHFDLEAHIQRIGLPAPGGKKELQDLVSDLMSSPLDYHRPLWQYHVVEGYEGGTVIVGRLHHCIADGIALMRLLLSMTDETPNPIEVENEEISRRRRGPFHRLTGPVLNAAGFTGKVTGKAVSEGFKTIRHPGRILDAARYGANFTGRLGKVTLRLPDPPSLFKDKLGVLKKAAWADPINLADVKAIGRVTGGTVNDVMATAVCGALRRYLEDKGEQTAGLNFRAFIPFNLRPVDQPIKMGNKFGLVFLKLPIGTVDPIERLQIIKNRMDELKSSTEPEVALTLLSTVGMLPKDMESALFKIFHAKGTAVMTNVPGPQKQLYLAGSPLRHILGWVPQAGNVALGISILSYNGEILLGINTDAGVVPDPQKIIEFFDEEYAELLDLVHTVEADL